MGITIFANNEEVETVAGDQTSVMILPGDVYYSTVRLGQMDERLLRVEDALGRRMRNPKV